MTRKAPPPPNPGAAGLAEYQRKVAAGEIEPAERLNPIEKAKANPTSRRYAINGKCWDCCSGQREEIRNCTVDCTLRPFRPYK